MSRILIVDDEKDLCQILSEEVEHLGFKACQAFDGSEALQLLSQPDSQIDAVLSDINMPVMSGLALLTKLRELKNPVPFVFLTAYGDPEKVATALRLGALDFLNKPYDQAQLHKVLTRAAKMGEALKQVDAELQALVQKSGLSGATLEDFKKAQHAILLMKRTAHL